MSRKNPALFRQFGQASMAGVTLASCIFVGVGWGLLMDKWLGTKPLMMFIFLLLGIIAGFYNVIKIVKSINTNGEQ